MTDLSTPYMPRSAPDNKTPAQGLTPYEIEDAHWGYIIRSLDQVSPIIRAAQSLSRLVGCLLLAAALGLWLLPSIVFGAEALFMRIFASIVFVALATLLLWYASRGARSEIQIDLSSGEIRSVIRNYSNKQTLLGCFGFDCITDVTLDLVGESGETDLALVYRNTGGRLIVATGQNADLVDLRNRLRRDVMVGSHAD